VTPSLGAERRCYMACVPRKPANGTNNDLHSGVLQGQLHLSKQSLEALSFQLRKDSGCATALHP
jgi:hypothetical protein